MLVYFTLITIISTLMFPSFVENYGSGIQYQGSGGAHYSGGGGHYGGDGTHYGGSKGYLGGGMWKGFFSLELILKKIF
jgi:hypothetical protein